MKTLFATVIALPLLVAAAHAAPMIANGDFSQSSYTANSQFGTSGGGQGVTGWTGNGGYDLYFFDGTATTVSANGQYGATGKEKLWAVTTSPTGGNFVALDGDSGVRGGISQTVTGLTVGSQYALTFSWGGGQLQSRTGNTTESLAVSLGDQSFTTNVVANPSGGFTGWFTNTFTYTATAATEVLTFLSIGTPSGLPPIATLDGVSIAQVTPAAVPEPTSMMLCGAGLIGMGFFRRKRA